MTAVYSIQKAEKTFHLATANQQHLRINEVDVANLSTSKLTNRIEIKKELFLKEDGTAHIVFDVSKLTNFTIAVGNIHQEIANFITYISPDCFFFRQAGGKKMVREKELELVKIDTFLKYVKVTIQGHPGNSLFIFLQGVK